MISINKTIEIVSAFYSPEDFKVIPTVIMNCWNRRVKKKDVFKSNIAMTFLLIIATAPKEVVVLCFIMAFFVFCDDFCVNNGMLYKSLINRLTDDNYAYLEATDENIEN